jgi:threonyl-tRNA synthetase
MKKNESLDNIRHSAAHLLAQAVLELFPGTQLTIGPTTEHGFFYDFLPPKNFKEEDLPKIEAKMKELAKKKYDIVGKQVTKQEARKLFDGNKFKQELLDVIADDEVTVYCQGDFCDLCKGGHVKNTSEIKHFKITSLAGSYWRADKSNTPLQRIYGVAFETKEDLDHYLTMVEEAKKYDHRKLGKELDLFHFDPVAPGTPFFHHKGLVIYNKMIEYMRHMLKKDYKEVKTPMIMNESLWRTSGHYDNYKENMYFTLVDEVQYCVKPMNCPGSILMYKNKPHSYKEFPLRLAEYGLVYRYELSGVLHGLFRVRSFTQDDAHVYCMEEHIESEIIKILDLAKAVYDRFAFKKVKMYVSTRPEKYIGSDTLWEKATNALKQALKTRNLDFDIDEGGGAFYGPKIDMIIEDTMGREWQCGTVQVDFFMPQNFNLEYIKSDQSKAQPIMLHRVIYGSIERFLGIILENYKGKFPFWIAPVQAKILTITDTVKDYAQQLFETLQDADIRVELDSSGDQIGAQIRNAQLQHIPWMIVIGKKEVEQGTVTLRGLDGKQEFGLKVEDLISRAMEHNTF